MARLKISFKTLFLLLSIVLLGNSVSAQTLYNLEWDYDGVFFHGLMIYNNEEDIRCRIGYTEQGSYNVMEVDYQYTIDEEYGEYIFLDAIDGEFIEDGEGSISTLFHFYWLVMEQGELDGPYVISDEDLNRDQIPEPAGIDIDELPRDSMTSDYLLQYYLPEEAEYKQLIYSEKQKPIPTISTNKDVTMHFIALCNTRIADIGTSVKEDLKRMESEVEGISDALGIDLNKTIISDKEFRKDILTQRLANFSPGPEDIVIFYYSGHGFRYDDQQEKFPELDLRFNNYQPTGPENSINLYEIYQQICSRGARLNILLGDCCNNKIGMNKRTGVSFLGSRSTVNADLKKLNELFVESSGNILAAGANIGEYSWCSDQGGFFSNSFISALREESSMLTPQDAPLWADILNQSKNSTLKKARLCKECTDQNVIFEQKP